MAKFITRIELKDANEENRNDLTEAMIMLGFRDTIIADGVIYKLPGGEYFKEGDFSRTEIFDEAITAAKSTGKFSWVLVTESIDSSFILQIVGVDK